MVRTMGRGSLKIVIRTPSGTIAVVYSLVTCSRSAQPTVTYSAKNVKESLLVPGYTPPIRMPWIGVFLRRAPETGHGRGDHVGEALADALHHALGLAAPDSAQRRMAACSCWSLVGRGGAWARRVASLSARAWATRRALSLPTLW